MDPPFGVVPDAVAVALKPHAAPIQGRQSLPGVQGNLVVQWVFGDIPRLRGASEVAGLMCAPEGPALDIPEALLALGLPQRH